MQHERPLEPRLRRAPSQDDDLRKCTSVRRRQADQKVDRPKCLTRSVLPTPPWSEGLTYVAGFIPHLALKHPSMHLRSRRICCGLGMFALAHSCTASPCALAPALQSCRAYTPCSGHQARLTASRIAGLSRSPLRAGSVIECLHSKPDARRHISNRCALRRRNARHHASVEPISVPHHFALSSSPTRLSVPVKAITIPLGGSLAAITPVLK